MPAGSIGAIDTSAITMLVGQPQFAISNSAALRMDSAATALSATGAPNTIAAPVSSMSGRFTSSEKHPSCRVGETEGHGNGARGRHHGDMITIAQVDSSEAALLERAAADCIEAMLQRVTVGRSIPDAIRAFDHLRQQFEIERITRDRTSLRIRLRPR
jgi:hypothetical protein